MNTNRLRSRKHYPGFTLVEVVIVLGIVALLAAIIVPAMQPAGVQALESAARRLVADLRLARSMAVQTGSDWSVQFDLVDHSYEVIHTGSGGAPTLRNPLAAPGQEDGPYQVELNGLQAGGNLVQRVVMIGAAVQQTRSNVTDITFVADGGTGPVRSEDTLIWVGDCSETGARYVRIAVSWITGHVRIDPPAIYDEGDLDPMFE